MPKLFRYAGSALIVVGGAVHLSLYATGYKSIPYVGLLFLGNVFAALFIAVALATRPLGAFAVAGLLFSAGTIGGFVLSRTVGILGFMEVGWDTKSILALAAEVATLVVLGIWFKATRPTRDSAAVVGERQSETAPAGADASVTA